ncbi:zinc ribbon domain-containing protein [Bradymonadaceae bacterium TMQ3]|uniref:Zinc ribbon domain-containing protein n=2 Tax=Lujinxingia sediminis TaxID=2480984 RepID=A0ABY0CYK8_9DELT|nr:zinc ribbon domain-containing protein [Bradymonadaceae bacterium TMQ3]RVU48967.1 zinc ribbon domain-containing protein [Lujinxingia sediminis]TXC78261.1 zinc ribbon domain-containing protein [Bradymonadales bacterium TMQ1]
MRRLDAIHGGREWESHIEDAVAARHQALPEPQAQAHPVKDAPRVSRDDAKANDSCSECGEPLSPRARFCAICGTPREVSLEERPRHTAPLTSEVTG